jgi:hypothetical protein
MNAQLLWHFHNLSLSQHLHVASFHSYSNRQDMLPLHQVRQKETMLSGDGAQTAAVGYISP